MNEDIKDFGPPVFDNIAPINAVNGKTIEFLVPGDIASSYSMTYPPENAVGVLTNDGAGDLSWVPTDTVNPSYYHNIKDFMAPVQSDIFHRFSYDTKLNPTNYTDGAYFGSSSAITPDGVYMVIGAPYNDYKSNLEGAVYVYKKENNTYTEVDILYPSILTGDPGIGTSVDISADGTYIIAGAIGDDTKGTDKGAVYIYAKDGAGWEEQTILYKPDNVLYENFGIVVGISADGLYAIAGTQFTTASNQEGCLCIYKRSGTEWNLQTQLTPTGLSADPIFCYSATISNNGEYVAVGATADDTKGTNVGSVSIYKRTGETWAKQTTLYASVTTTNLQFGYDLSFSNDAKYLISGSDLERAFVFIRDDDTWTEQAILTAPIIGSDKVGVSVDISNDGRYAVCGAPNADFQGNNSGAIYVFVRNNAEWVYQSVIYANVNMANSNLGLVKTCISGDGQYIISGAINDNTLGAGVGTVLLFKNDTNAHIMNNVNVDGVIKINDIQVVGAQGTTVNAVGAMTTIGANTGTPGSGLSLIGDTTLSDQSAALMNDLAAIQGDLVELRTQLNLIITALKTHGLIAS